MAEKHNLRNGGRILVDALVTQGADHAFCVPGESYLAVLDAFHDTPEMTHGPYDFQAYQKASLAAKEAREQAVTVAKKGQTT